MKKNFLYLGLMVLGFGLILTSCSDDDDVPDYTQKETTIASQTWQLADVIWTDTAGVDSTVFRDCLQDDTISFRLNHDYAFNSDSLDCSTGSLALPYGEGAWAFNFQEDSIALKFGDTTVHWAVDELTDASLQLSFGDSVDTDFYTKTLKFEPAATEAE